ncbi:MAG: M67 family metallopeptidase [Bacteroidota bacterium]
MIRMTDTLTRQIEHHGIRSYPEECCGMILGTNREGIQTVEEIIEIENSQNENRKRRFLITPHQYLQAERTALEKNMELLGFYHSHPDHPAIPSSFDTEHALPSFIYIIVSIAKGEAESITAWLLSENRLQMVKKSFVADAVQISMNL